MINVIVQTGGRVESILEVEEDKDSSSCNDKCYCTDQREGREYTRIRRR